ncbi:hypothetical protein H9L39_12388 [Fusarium oxysporum f. sp. albedinis]|nr:hypothetical protein H9L39_12388 [Fusarium oxysporum f. sp. albedinis]
MLTFRLVDNSNGGLTIVRGQRGSVLLACYTWLDAISKAAAANADSHISGQKPCIVVASQKGISIETSD